MMKRPSSSSADIGAASRSHLPRVVGLVRRAIEFARRHRWSLPLSLVSSVSLLQLASEMREGELASFDAEIARVVGGWRGTLDGLMLLLTTFGGGWSMTVFTTLLVLILLVFQRRREALFMSIAGLGTFALSTLLKLIFQRARPEDLGYMIPAPSSFSFPSGHALGSMGVLASAVVVLHVLGAPRALRLLAIVFAASFAPGVALSRVYFGVHYPSDVLGGQLAAAAWVSAVTGWFYPRLLPGEEALEPAPDPDAH